MKLEDLKKGMLVEGISSDGAVTLRDVEPGGDGAVEVIFKDAAGSIGERLLFRSIYVTCSPEVEGVTGRYFDSKGRESNSSAASYDGQRARRLWEVSAQLTGLKGSGDSSAAT